MNDLHFGEGLDDATQVVFEQVVVQRLQVRAHDGVVFQLSLVLRNGLEKRRLRMQNNYFANH